MDNLAIVNAVLKVVEEKKKLGMRECWTFIEGGRQIIILSWSSASTRPNVACLLGIYGDKFTPT